MSKLFEQLRARRQVTPTAGFLKSMHESAQSLREAVSESLKRGLAKDFMEFMKDHEDVFGKVQSAKVVSVDKPNYLDDEEFAEDPVLMCSGVVIDVTGKNGKTFRLNVENDAGDLRWFDALADIATKDKIFEEVMTSGEEHPQITKGEEKPVQTDGEEVLLKTACPSCGKNICLCGSGEPLKEACLKEEEQIAKGEEVLLTSTCPCCGKKICVCGTGEPLSESCKLKEDEEVPPVDTGDQGAGEEQSPENQDAPKKTCYRFEVNDSEGQIKALIDYIGKTAAPGHSFEVVVDPGNAETEKKFFIDGDGSDRIGEVCVEECTEEEMSESCKEALAKKLNESDVDYTVKAKCGVGINWYLVPGASSEEDAKERFLKNHPDCEVVATDTIKWDSK